MVRGPCMLGQRPGMEDHTDRAARIHDVPGGRRLTEYPGTVPFCPVNFATSPAAWIRFAASAADIWMTFGTVLFTAVPTWIMCQLTM